jgi:hypothetical protein
MPVEKEENFWPSNWANPAPFKWVMEALSLCEKQSGHEAKHSPLFCAKAKRMLSYSTYMPSQHDQGQIQPSVTL